MTYLLDTVTLSELRKKKRASSAVFAWQKKQTGSASISVVTMNEICFGILSVEKQDVVFAKHLKIWYQEILAASSQFTILPVELSVAEKAACFRYNYKMNYNDALIAATAFCNKLTLATRNVSDFKKTGIMLINPWDYSES